MATTPMATAAAAMEGRRVVIRGDRAVRHMVVVVVVVEEEGTRLRQDCFEPTRSYILACTTMVLPVARQEEAAAVAEGVVDMGC